MGRRELSWGGEGYVPSNILPANHSEFAGFCQSEPQTLRSYTDYPELEYMPYETTTTNPPCRHFAFRYLRGIFQDIRAR